MTLTPDVLADMRRYMSATPCDCVGGALWNGDDHDSTCPITVIALLDHIAALESRLSDMTTVAIGRFRELQDADAREKDQRQRAEAAEVSVAKLERRWRSAWCIDFGRNVNADNPQDCVTLGEQGLAHGLCEACTAWAKERP